MIVGAYRNVSLSIVDACSRESLGREKRVSESWLTPEKSAKTHPEVSRGVARELASMGRRTLTGARTEREILRIRDGGRTQVRKYCRRAAVREDTVFRGEVTDDLTCETN